MLCSRRRQDLKLVEGPVVAGWVACSELARNTPEHDKTESGPPSVCLSYRNLTTRGARPLARWRRLDGAPENEAHRASKTQTPDDQTETAPARHQRLKPNAYLSSEHRRRCLPPLQKIPFSVVSFCVILMFLSTSLSGRGPSMSSLHAGVCLRPGRPGVDGSSRSPCSALTDSAPAAYGQTSSPS